MPTLHVHLDESGNWEFSRKGSRYFVLAIAWTFEPRPLARTLTDLRFRLLRTGLNIDSFHAAPDKQATRDLVVKTMLADDSWNFAAVVMEKRKINPSIYEPQRFYPEFAGALLRFVLRGRAGRRADRVLIYADTIPMDSNKKREAVLKAMKTTCVACKGTTEYHVFSHRRESNPWLQAVDYCCWAVARKWENGDTRTYDQLRPRLGASELEITGRGDGTTYY
jgi:hypothetical protein